MELKWDRRFALEQAGDDEAMLTELLELFRHSAAADLVRMKAGATVGDPVAISDAAHSIKGAAASLGIEAVRALAAEVEKAGRRGDLAGTLQQLATLEQMLAHLDALR